jgi:ribosomal protein S10
MIIRYTLIINSFYITFLKQFLNKIQGLNFNSIKFFFLPVKQKKFTVLKSPHVYKKAREQFEIKLYTLLIIFEDINNYIKLINFLIFLNKGQKYNTFLPLTIKIKENIQI